MTAVDPVSAKLTVQAVRIHKDGSREDLGVLLSQTYVKNEEEDGRNNNIIS
jgi:hypothetical protein